MEIADEIEFPLFNIVKLQKILDERRISYEELKKSVEAVDTESLDYVIYKELFTGDLEMVLKIAFALGIDPYLMY